MNSENLNWFPMARPVLRHYTTKELIEEIEYREGGTLIFVRHKTNVQREKYTFRASGGTLEITKLMLLGSDFLINRLGDEEDDDEEEDLTNRR